MISWDAEADARVGVGQRLQGAFREGRALRRRCGLLSEEQSWDLSPPEARLSEGQAERAAASWGDIDRSPQACQAQSCRTVGETRGLGQ